jgi:hypothetical protein
MTIQDKLARLKGLKKDLGLIGMDAMRETEKTFLDMNKEQMSKGKRSDGQRIGTYRLESYERFKTQKFPRSGGWVNLELTGAFKDAMRIKITAKKYEVYSDDSKEAKLLKWYSPLIYGVNDEDFEIYRSAFFYPALMKRIRQQVNG